MNSMRPVVGMAAALTVALALRPAPVAADGSYASAWPRGVERVWVGPDHWANRLQDWRVRDGRVECAEGRARFPLRTLHLLTRTVDDPRDGFVMQVRTGAIGDGASRGWRGFLVGAGGADVDYRLTALVHHRPAEDGGLLAVVDAAGRVDLRDNGRAEKGGNQWSIAGPLDPSAVSPLEADHRLGPEPGAAGGGAVDLRLEVRGGGDRCSVSLTARDAASGRRLSEASYDDVPVERLDGGLALASHLGLEGSGAGFWFESWTADGAALAAHDGRRLGPVLCVQYTVSGDALKLTAQLPPLGATDTPTASLQTMAEDGRWATVATERVTPDSWTCAFRLEPWDASRETPFRVVYDLVVQDDGPAAAPRTERHRYEGVIAREPTDADQVVVASLNCHKVYTGGLRWNHGAIWFPHAELVDAVAAHEPHLLFFAGDQIYEGDLDPAQTRPEDMAILDYLNKWYRWCWAFSSLTRRIPTVTIPDDHDVYHGNLWGAGGKAARAAAGITAQDSGGYKMGPRFVNAVHRTQTSHLPDPVDPAPIEQGITVYFTRLDWAGLSCAILADRQFKSSPTVMVPAGDVKNGWFQNPDFDPAADADVPGAVLLGERQLRFLEDWAVDWSDGTWMKLVLSQTIFANVATLPEDARSGAVLPSLPHLPRGEMPETYRLAADADSNGWPQSGRNAALRAMRRGRAVHLAGDQHLGSLVHYGVEGWRDAGIAFCSPAIANTWPRRWYPPRPGLNREPGAPRYTGDFLDGFGNHVTVMAVANPVISGREPARLYDRAPGYGIARFHRRTGRITLECWPRWVDPRSPDAAQYPGWPRRFEQDDNDGRPAIGLLPAVEVTGIDEPVVQVIHQPSGQVEYARRVRGSVGRLPVFRPGLHAIGVGEPGTERWRVIRGLRPSADPTWTLRVGWGRPD